MLRRNSQHQEETKKEHGIALKIMEEESTDLEDEDMAMMTCKFKKFFKKTKENARKKNFSRAKSTDWEQFIGCFNGGKLDHIIKNCPQLKEEQEAETSRKQGRK